MSILVLFCQEPRLRASKGARCNGNATFIEVVTFAVRRIADGLKVDSEEQLCTCRVEINRQSHTPWRRHQTVTAAQQITARDVTVSVLQNLCAAFLHLEVRCNVS